MCQLKAFIILKMRVNASLIRRALVAAAVLEVLGALCIASSHPHATPQGARSTEQSDVADCSNLLPYSPDATHIWNRVHRRLLERHDALGKAWGCDEVDPLLWLESKHVLVGAAYTETVRLLDEFVSAHAERLIHDPLRRAIFQRDLWAVFDWLAQRTDDHPRQRAQLEHRLARLIKAVALSTEEIATLPDNYAQIRDSTTADGLPLPGTSTGWLLIGREDGTPVAPMHSFAFPRSLFLVYLKLPLAGSEPAAYLQAMRDYSRERPETDDCTSHACNPPQFPVGSTLALVRRALLISTKGQPTISPITESVQLRRYLGIPPHFTIDYNGAMQQVAEFQFTRRSLAQGRIELRRVGEDEPDFPVFDTQGIDFFEDRSIQGGSRTLCGCHGCHQGVGAISFTSYSRVHFEHKVFFILMRATTEAQEASVATMYLQGRDSWKLLQRRRG